MVQDTNLTLTVEEMETIANSRFFFVKRNVTQKIHLLFGTLEQELLKVINDESFFVKGVVRLNTRGKIYKGENYHFMPYVLLDCPREFSSDAVFAFRSMFLWGNEFSFSLHLQGNALEIFRKKIQMNIALLRHENFFICVNESPWEYFFDEKNYVSLDEMIVNRNKELQTLILGKDFIKLSRKLDLPKYQQAVKFGVETFNKLMDLLNS